MLVKAPCWGRYACRSFYFKDTLYPLQKDIFHCMGLALAIHLFRIRINFVEILLYLSLLRPSIQVGL